MAAVSARQYPLQLDELRENALRACQRTRLDPHRDSLRTMDWPDDSTTAECVAAGFSEVSLSDAGSGCQLWLAPLLRELSHSHERRWLTLLDPPASLDLRWLRNTGLDGRQLRIIRSKPGMNTCALCLELLASGLSHTLISWLELRIEQRQSLEIAAHSGNCRSLNIVIKSAAAA